MKQVNEMAFILAWVSAHPEDEGDREEEGKDTASWEFGLIQANESINLCQAVFPLFSPAPIPLRTSWYQG